MPTLYFVFRRLPPVLELCTPRIDEKCRATLGKAAKYSETMRGIVDH